MIGLQIVDIDLTMSEKDFSDAIQDEISNYSENMSISIKLLKTKHGNSMYKIQVDNDDNSSAIIVGEQDSVNGNIHFHPIKLSNFNDSFYKVNLAEDIAGEDRDPSIFLCYALRNICKRVNGTFGYIAPDGGMAVVKDGKEKRKLSVGLVDENGNVYSSYGAKSIEEKSRGINFSVNKPIAQWLQENPDVATAIQPLPINDKMNYIGKYLIQARMNDEIETDEFTDIFCQAGLIGYTDNTVLGIYKLFM